MHTDSEKPYGSGDASYQAAGGEAVQQTMLRIVRDYMDRHSGSGTHERFLADVERLLITEALVRSDGNQSHAAKLLGLTRPTLHAKLQRYGIVYQR